MTLSDAIEFFAPLNILQSAHVQKICNLVEYFRSFL